MKKFNQEIQVSVSVDSIAQNLLNMFKPDEKHAELVVETIVGNAIKDKRVISQLYNSLNGSTNEINFKVNDMVVCSATHVNYFKKEDGEKDYRYEKLGVSKVLEIDLFRDEKLKVEFQFVNRNFETETKTQWVSHLKCSNSAS